MQQVITKAIGKFHELNLTGIKKRPSDNPIGRPLVVGFLSAPSGLGEGARLIYQALEVCGANPSCFDLTPHFQPDRSNIDQLWNFEDDGKGPIIIHVNPPELVHSLALLKKFNLNERRLIGIWAWEQDTLPKSWILAEQWVDELWASSKYLQHVFQNSLSRPVHYTGYPAFLLNNQSDFLKPKKDKKEFTFFTSFDPESGLNRKNPQGVVDAFLRAFPNNDTVRLIIKITDSSFRSSIPKQWRDDNRISIRDEILQSQEMIELIGSCDCVVSLHRAEGYGFLIANALANGIPAITTNCSATSEFLDCPNAFGILSTKIPATDISRGYSTSFGSWANPDLSDAIDKMVYLRSLSESKKAILSTKSEEWFRNNHSPKAFMSRIPQTTKNLMELNN